MSTTWVSSSSIQNEATPADRSSALRSAASFPRQRVLVLGGGHFVASAVQGALEASDWATPVRFSGPAIALSGDALSGIDAVFNGTAGSPSAILSYGKALHDALQAAGAAIRVVHLSSMTVYGSLTGSASENSPLRPDIGAYGAAQIAAESLAARHGRSVILRPGCEYGPGCPQWSERIARLLREHRLGDLGAAGDGVCNLLFLDDLTLAVQRALRVPGIEGARFNLAMRAPPTWNEYFVRFARALGAVPVSRIGMRRLKMEARLLAPPLKALEMVERRLSGAARVVPPAITPSLLGACGQDLTLDVGGAERLLGMDWTPLDPGLQRAAAAYSSGNTSMRRNSMG